MSLAGMLVLWLVISLVLILAICLLYREPRETYDSYLREEMDQANDLGWLGPVEPEIYILRAAIDPDEFDPTDLTKGGGTFEITDLNGDPVPEPPGEWEPQP